MTEYRACTVRSLVIGSGIPKVCVPLVAKDEAELGDALTHLAGVSYDFVEWRGDHFAGLNDPDRLASAVKQIRDVIGEHPLLFTIRTAKEGGEVDLPFETYEKRNLQAAETKEVDLVDVELFTAGEHALDLVEKLHQAGVKVVGSSHDFQKTPENDDMLSRLRKMQEADMDITKLAVMPKTRQDVLRLLEVTVRMREEFADRPLVTMSMGPLGMISRAVGCFTGSAFTFATAGKSSAPGQMDAAGLNSVLQVFESNQ